LKSYIGGTSFLIINKHDFVGHSVETCN